MIHFELVTLDGPKFGQLVYEVILPTPDGSIGVFKDHMPLVSLASHGLIAIRHKASDPDEKLEYFATNGGVIEVLDNHIRLLADEADHESEIDEKEAQKAHDEAKKLIAEAKDKVSLDKAQSLIDRSRVRLQLASLKRHKRR